MRLNSYKPIYSTKATACPLLNNRQQSFLKSWVSTLIQGCKFVAEGTPLSVSGLTYVLYKVPILYKLSLKLDLI